MPAKYCSNFRGIGAGSLANSAEIDRVGSNLPDFIRSPVAAQNLCNAADASTATPVFTALSRLSQHRLALIGLSFD
jgi:hypothetical protein